MKSNMAVRFVIAAMLAATFVFGVAGVSRAADTASITIHVIQCSSVPTTDWFTECHDNSVVGSTVKVGTATVLTDSTGNAKFANLAAGDYAVSAPVTGATSGFAYCSSPSGRAGGWHVNGVFTVSALAAGEQVICDSFGVVPPTVPTTATLTIHKRVCAVGEPTSDIFTDCHGDTDGVSGVVQLTANSTTTTVGASGDVSWTLNNGTYAITEDTHVAGAVSSRVYCSSDDGASSTEVPSTNGNFSATLNGVNIICDSYTLLSTGPVNNPTAVPTTAPTAAPTATAAGGTTTLPNTGVAPSNGSNNVLYGLLAALAVAGLAFGGAELARRRKN